jgi:hypothetical protein
VTSLLLSDRFHIHDYVTEVRSMEYEKMVTTMMKKRRRGGAEQKQQQQQKQEEE